MKHAEFEIGKEFTCADGRYRCTDKGTRVVVAIRLDIVRPTNGMDTRLLNQKQAEAEGWFNGPPYAIVEHLFDENDQGGCEPCP